MKYIRHFSYVAFCCVVLYLYNATPSIPSIDQPAFPPIQSGGQCEAYLNHLSYWDARGYDGDPIRGYWLRTMCDLENPCFQLDLHQKYWKPKGYDGELGRKLLLRPACEAQTKGLKDAARAAVDEMIDAGNTIAKTLKKFSMDVVHTMSKPLRDQIQNSFYAREIDPYRYAVARVRVSDDPVSDGESLHRQERFAGVKAAQEAFLGMELADHEVLDISFSLSGGGVRASLCGLGSLVGAHNIGLLPCVMTISAISGGTWILFPWVASGMDILSYREFYLKLWERGYPRPTPAEIKMMVDDAILMPFAFEKDVTLTSIWTAALANVLFKEFGDQRQRVRLSDLMNRTQYPVPVGEAAWADLSREGWDEETFEFTPYEVGGRWLKAYIPSWGLGRKYSNGASVNPAPEDTLPVGTFGSAFAVRASVVYKEIANAVPEFMRDALDKLMETKVGELHAGFSLIPNYTYGMKESPIRYDADIPLCDAGAGKILGIAPLISTYRGQGGRHPDVLFIFDSGANKPTVELSQLEKQARRINLPLPRLSDAPKSFHAILNVYEEVSAAGAVDLNKPVVVYLPRVTDAALLADPKYETYKKILGDFNLATCTESGPCGTFEFNWPREKSEKVVTQTEFNIVAAQEVIKEVMRSVVLAKRAAAQPGTSAFAVKRPIAASVACQELHKHIDYWLKHGKRDEDGIVYDGDWERGQKLLATCRKEDPQNAAALESQMLPGEGCRELAKHVRYWKEYDGDPAKGRRHLEQCKKESPALAEKLAARMRPPVACKELKEHGAYWWQHGNIDKDPKRRASLLDICHEYAPALADEIESTLPPVAED